MDERARRHRAEAGRRPPPSLGRMGGRGRPHRAQPDRSTHGGIPPPRDARPGRGRRGTDPIPGHAGGDGPFAGRGAATPQGRRLAVIHRPAPSPHPAAPPPPPHPPPPLPPRTPRPASPHP